MKKERVEYLDALRTLAAIAVVMLHVAANRWYHVPVRSFEFQFMNLVNGLVRWSTPVFVMISGAVFLDRDISVKALFCKYLPRLVTVYLFWVVLYNASVYCPFLNPQNRQVFTLGVFVKQALLGYSDLWFLPMLMGLYLCVPVYRVLVQREKATDYFLGAAFVLCFLLPTLAKLAVVFLGGRMGVLASMLVELVQKTQTGVLSVYGFYFVLGHRLHSREPEPSHRKWILGLAIAGGLLTAALNGAACWLAGEARGEFFGNYSAFVALTAAGVFLWMRKVRPEASRAVRLAVRLSKYTLGVYLVHTLLILVCNRLDLDALLGSQVAAIPVMTVTVALASFAVSAVLNHIPVVRRWLV